MRNCVVLLKIQPLKIGSNEDDKADVNLLQNKALEEETVVPLGPSLSIMENIYSKVRTEHPRYHIKVLYIIKCVSLFPKEMFNRVTLDCGGEKRALQVTTTPNKYEYYFYIMYTNQKDRLEIFHHKFKSCKQKPLKKGNPAAAKQ